MQLRRLDFLLKSLKNAEGKTQTIIETVSRRCVLALTCGCGLRATGERKKRIHKTEEKMYTLGIEFFVVAMAIIIAVAAISSMTENKDGELPMTHKEKKQYEELLRNIKDAELTGLAIKVEVRARQAERAEMVMMWNGLLHHIGADNLEDYAEYKRSGQVGC